MDANHINAIMTATKVILSGHLGLEVKMLKPYAANKKSVPSNEISVILGVSGQLKGQLICSMDRSTAMSIIGKLMGGMEVTVIDDMGWSAIQEFGNWVAGHTATELASVGCVIDVTPPVVNEGASKFHSTSTFITVPLESSVGEINIHVSVKSSVLK